jgi:CBS domain containing-hemolysin-like protein
MLFDLIIIIIFLFSNAFFVGAEFALERYMSIFEEQRGKITSYSQKIALKISENIDDYHYTFKFGFAASIIGFGWYGKNIAIDVFSSFTIFHLIDEKNINIETTLLTFCIFVLSFFVIVFINVTFGNIAPTILSQKNISGIAIFTAIPFRIFSFCLYPVIWLLKFISEMMLKTLGISHSDNSQTQIVQDEIKYLIDESSKLSSFDESDKNLIENIFEFSTIPVSQIMTTRNNISAIEIEITKEKLFVELLKEEYSRMPVYKENIDYIQGILYAKDILPYLINNLDFNIADIIRKTVFVDENEFIDNVLRRMQRNKVQMAVALDRFNGCAGIVTMEDILEEIVGEIQDEYDDELKIIEQIENGVYQVIAHASISDLNDYLPISIPESDDYKSIGGLVITEIGSIPEVNEEIIIENYRIIVLKRSKRKVELLRLELLK